ncbi:MAG: signal peptidase I [Oscillospiraceae bacterium]|nr:signal peptidase I [Oscillospiraceae bacterium]
MDEEKELTQPDPPAQDARSILKRIGSAVLTAVLVLSLGLMVYVTACTVRGKPAVLLGRCIFQVVTGSMEPTLHVGECILVERCDPETLKTGDVIVYVSEDPEIYGKFVTHRIVAREPDGSFITRGDANPVEDALAVRPEQIQGKYIRKSRLYTWASSFADLRKSALFLIMLGVTAMAFYELRTVLRLGKEVQEETAQERQERLIREAIDKEKARLEAEGFVPPEEDAGKEEQN